MLRLWFNFGLVCSLVSFPRQNNAELTRLLYHKGGNMSFVGIFNDRFGADCSTEVGRGLEEIAGVIWTVETLNKHRYIPGVTVGLAIFGVCEEESRKELLKAVEEHVRLNANDSYFGVLTTAEIFRKLPAESFPDRNILHIEHVLNTDILTDATVQLLINLQWMRVSAVVSDSANTLKSFKEKASEEGLFVQDEMLMNNRRNSCLQLNGSREPPVIVGVGAFANISNLSEKICEENITLILTPTDFLFDVGLLDLPQRDSVVSLPPTGDKTVLSGYIRNTRRQGEFFRQKPPTKGPLFIGAAGSVLKLLKPIKTAVREGCQKKQIFPEPRCADFMDEVLRNRSRLLPQKSMKISPDDVEETLKVLKIEPSSNAEMFLYVTSVINANASEDIAIFQIFNLKTKKFQPILVMINDDSLTNGQIGSRSDMKIDYSGRDFKVGLEETQTASHLGDPVINLLQKLVGGSAENFNTRNDQIDNVTLTVKSLPPERGCDLKDGQACPNLASTAATPSNGTTEHDPEVVWRFLTWVSINTSLGFVGVTCTLSAMLFVIIRLCRDDILEGSPCFTLLLMISVIFTYFSSLPFHVEFSPDNDFICSYRKIGPPVAFAILFSLLLSRSFLLAFSENAEEFVTHINGYLQSVLCFFMIGVQASIISQNWFFSKEDSNCVDVHDKMSKIIFALGYDFFLLILLACVSPFIIRSKQNYKEGFLFSISVFFITVVWSAWISFYVLLPDEHKDAAIAIGLNSTASVVLFCIFIPQTYFMSTPFDQTGALRSLSSLDGRDVNFKSSQALNESAFGSITYKSCEMGVSNPNFLTSRSNASNNPITRETMIDVSPETSQPN